MGDYFCYVRYDDGRVLKSHCIVECAATQSEEITDERKKTEFIKNSDGMEFSD